MNKEYRFNYVKVNKMSPTVKEFALNFSELKFIVDSLEEFDKNLFNEINVSSNAYKRAVLEQKLNKCREISTKIKTEINYCARCNRKEKEETGLGGMEAAINGGINDKR